MWFGPTAYNCFRNIHMLAANLDLTNFLFPSLSCPLLRWRWRTRPFFCMAFSRFNLSPTKDCQNCLKTYSLVNLAFTQFRILPHPASLFVEQDSLFFPCRRTHRRKSVRLSSDYRPREHVPKTSSQFDPNSSRRDLCHLGQPNDDDQGQTQSPTAEALITHVSVGVRKPSRSRYFLLNIPPCG